MSRRDRGTRHVARDTRPMRARVLVRSFGSPSARACALHDCAHPARDGRRPTRPQPRTVDERAELVAFATGTAIRKGSLAPGPGAARPGSHSRPARGNLGPSDRGGPSSLHEPVLGGTTNTLNSRRFV
jgi:hypothetical protein